MRLSTQRCELPESVRPVGQTSFIQIDSYRKSLARLWVVLWESIPREYSTRMFFESIFRGYPSRAFCCGILWEYSMRVFCWNVLPKSSGVRSLSYESSPTAFQTAFLQLPPAARPTNSANIHKGQILLQSGSNGSSRHFSMMIEVLSSRNRALEEPLY